MTGFSASPRQEDEKIGTIQGRIPDSIPEYRVAKALWKLKLEFIYQEQTFLGAEFISIDFLVLTPLKATPLFVDGEYFHGRAGEKEKDSYKRALLDSLNKDRWFPHETIPALELGDQAAADGVIRGLFG